MEDISALLASASRNPSVVVCQPEACMDRLGQDLVTVFLKLKPGETKLAFSPELLKPFLEDARCIWRYRSVLLGCGIAAYAGEAAMLTRHDFNPFASSVCRREAYGTVVFVRYMITPEHDCIHPLTTLELLELSLNPSARFRALRLASDSNLEFCVTCQKPYRRCDCLVPGRSCYSPPPSLPPLELLARPASAVEVLLASPFDEDSSLLLDL